jgi:membrane-associated protease RseP (regulator of RpoE activity)
VSSVWPVIVGIAVVVVGIVVSIALHELGHMVPAKAFGVRVSQYMIGFGPTLWSRRRGETEYGVKAVPLGGFVRMVGMMPGPRPGQRRGRGFFAQVIDDARRASAEEIRPGEEHRAFYHLSTPKKLVVMLGGPVMNLVLAVVIAAVVMVGIGLQTLTPTVSAVSACVPTTSSTQADPCPAGAAAAPAAAAGLRPGDRIVAYAGVAVSSWDELTAAIADGGTGAAVPVVVERDGARRELQVTPVEATRAVAAADGTTDTVTSAFVGVSPSIEFVPAPLSAVPGAVGQMVGATAAGVVTLPAKVAEAVGQAFSGEERSQDSVMSVVGVGRAAVDVAGADTSVLSRVQMMLSLLASLNVALFVFNLIPLLPLDGGHVVNALYEGARRTVARARGARVLPAPADVARMMPVAYVMFVVLVGVGAALMLADVIDPVRIT